MEPPGVQSSVTDRLRAAAHQRSAERPGSDRVTLDDKVRALACLGAALSVNTPSTSLDWLVEQALAASATVEDVVSTFLVVAPTIGAARVVATTPTIAHAIGYDIDQALEVTDDDPDGPTIRRL